MLYIDSIQNLLVSEYLDPCLQFARPRQHLDPEKGAVWETFRKMPNSCLNDQLSSLIWCYVMPDTNWILAENKICELDWIGMSKIVTRTLIVQTAAPREVPLFHSDSCAKKHILWPKLANGHQEISPMFFLERTCEYDGTIGAFIGAVPSAYLSFAISYWLVDRAAAGPTTPNLGFTLWLFNILSMF